MAPKVGLTAQELQNLSGPDVLQAVKNAMDQANIPMEQQVFYLESIANDASLLIPLLEDMGQKNRELTQEYKDLNVALSQTDINNLREMDALFKQVSTQLSSSFAQAVVGASDQITWLGNVISDAVVYWGALFDSFSDQADTLDGLFIQLAGLLDEQAELEQQLASMDKEYGAASLWDALFGGPTSKSQVREELDAVNAEIEKLQALRAEMEDGSQPVQPALPPMPTSQVYGGAGDDIDTQTQKIIDANQRILDSLTRDLATQEELVQQTYESQIEQINTLVLTEEQIKAAGYESLIQLQSAYLIQAEADRVAALERIKQETANAATDMESQFTQLANAININTQTMERAATGWANSFSSELANMVTTGELDFSRLAESIINDLIRITIQANITNQLLSAMGLAGTTPASTGSPPQLKPPVARS